MSEVMIAGREAAVRVSGLTRSFGAKTVIAGLDLEIRRGEFLALLGPSGTGKSTLLRILAGLDSAATGTVAVPRQRAVMFQDPRLLPWRRVWQNIVLGLAGVGRSVAETMLEEVGLPPSFAGRWPATLSGGEAQRVALARALIREPDLLLLDEPFGALDALTRIRMQDLLREVHRKHDAAVLLVTHDVEEAILLADRVIVLSDGALRADVRIDQPRPRSRASATVVQLRQRLLAELGVLETGDRDASVA